LQCIATGVFIYVTFFEILQRELGDEPSFAKLAFMAVGFILLALLALIPEEKSYSTHSPAAENCTLY
jgi:zinc transporter 1/2/3